MRLTPSLICYYQQHSHVWTFYQENFTVNSWFPQRGLHHLPTSLRHFKPCWPPHFVLMKYTVSVPVQVWWSQYHNFIIINISQYLCVYHTRLVQVWWCQYHNYKYLSSVNISISLGILHQARAHSPANQPVPSHISLDISLDDLILCTYSRVMEFEYRQTFHFIL